MTDRQRLLALAAAAVLLVIVGNLTSGTPSTRPPVTAAPPAGPSAAASFPVALSDPTPRIAIVYGPDGRGSTGMGELAWEGVKRAADQLSAELREVTSSPGDTGTDRQQRLELLAEAGYDPIFVIGATYAAAVATVAPRHHSIWFGLLDDGSVDGSNVIGILFHEEQGAYLVGAAAALTSRTGNVGFVDAAPVPSVQRYEAGFTAGARAANPRVRVQVAYLSPPSGSSASGDPAMAGKAALRMHGAGADVIFAGDEATGSGVIQAARDGGFWAIGVDTDRFEASAPSLRGAVLTSMLKRADVAVYTITMEVASGVPKDGNNVFGLDRAGVGYSLSGGFVDPIRAQLDAFASKIASGEILVPTKP